MFYSHQLLARKAPLGQIWMAATMHAKINRRKLDKLDIIKICEEILYPSVPMALRLSGILMGGVVIVYERKVKLLYDDVTRFLVEINEAWKIKSVADPTVLPKGKTQAKYEAVTLPDNVVDMEVEQPMHFSDASITSTRFQRMRLDDLDEHYININTKEDDLSQHYHQAEAVNITIFDDYGSGLAETDFYNRFEKFDIDGDEETQMNITPQEHPQAAPNVIPSPAQQNEHPQAPAPDVHSTPRQQDPLPDDVTMDPRMEGQEEQQRKERSSETQGDEEDAPRRRPLKRKARRGLIHVLVDNDQIMIPGSVYQSWLQDASNIASKRRRKNKPGSPSLSTRISSLMDLPPVALISGLEGFPAVNYPAPLMELWRDCTQTNPAHRSPSGGISPKAPEKSATHSPTEGFYRQQVPDMPPQDSQSEVGSHRRDSIEMLRTHLENMDFEVANEALPSDLLVTPGSPGKGSTSIPSSGSGHSFWSMEPEILPSGRPRRKQHSLSRASLGNLDPVEEEIPLEQNRSGYKLKKLSEHGHTPDHELMEETGPTQTPHPVVTDASIDKITQSIRTQLKSHFDTPGAPQFESLDQLAAEMSRKKAAQLFYQTCVLATYDFVKVQQTVAYGDILISRGPKM